MLLLLLRERYSPPSRWRSRQSSSPPLATAELREAARRSLLLDALRASFLCVRCSVNQSLTRRHVRLLRSHALSPYLCTATVASAPVRTPSPAARDRVVFDGADAET